MYSRKVLDFKVVKLKLSETDQSHSIYIKEHSSRSYDEDKPYGKTLFVVNIPPYVDDLCLNTLFSEVGQISSITLQKGIPTKDSDQAEICFNGYQTAYIVFNDRESLVKSLNLIYLKPIISENKKLLSGLTKYAKEYNNSICDQNILYKKASKVIKAYDKVQEGKKNLEKEQVDDEGWTVVTKKGRNPGLALKESVEIKLTEKHKKKMKKKSLQNFYSFQIRDSKKKHLATLREQHEEAKRKIAEMKKTRKFKPF